eukprot:4835425-Pyramimonas_sp.AAC.1
MGVLTRWRRLWLIFRGPVLLHSEAALIRRRARRVLGCAMERPKICDPAPIPKLARVLRDSGHRWCRVGANVCDPVPVQALSEVRASSWTPETERQGPPPVALAA